MIVSAIVWAIGALCVVAIGAFFNHGAEGPDERYSGLEIGWCAVLWPLVVLILVGVEIYVRMKRGRA